MKKIIRADLEELVKIIQSYKELAEIIEVSPIIKAISDLEIASNCFYKIDNLAISLKKALKNVTPSVDKFSILVSNTVHYMPKNNIIQIGGYKLDIVIYGYKDLTRYQYCWHLDKHMKKSTDKISHPVFHFQAAGKLTEIPDSASDTLYIGTPRIPHPPMDIFLALHFILMNFFDKKSHPFVNLLLLDTRYCDLIKRAQKRMIDPYLNGLHDPTAHPDYNINTIYPTYI